MIPPVLVAVPSGIHRATVGSFEGLAVLNWLTHPFGVGDAFLTLILLIASVTDWQSRRIPNALIAVGLCGGLTASILGLSGLGLGACLAGAGLGLGLFLPLYAMRAVGAGDAKLMAVVGSLLGTVAVAWIVVYTGIAGAVLATVVLAVKGGWRKAFADVANLIRRLVWRISGVPLRVVESTGNSSVRLPYALAIFAGTLTWWVVGKPVS